VNGIRVLVTTVSTAAPLFSPDVVSLVENKIAQGQLGALPGQASR
jgi:hypothetical protein